MTTTARNPMPVLDVSAALQAAVAAAAEIARVGLSDSLTAFVAAPSGEQEAPQVLSPPPPQQQQLPPTVVPPVVNGPSNPSPHLLVATAVPPLPHHQNPVQYQQPPSSLLSTQLDNHRTSPTASDQCTGQDAAGDHLQPMTNNNEIVAVADSADAAGEKTFEESEEDAAKRLARSRERNREHARRTRLRKKAQLEALQSKVRGLEAEKKALKQKIEECSIASILINLAETQDESQQSPHDETTTLLDATIQRQEENQQDTEAKIHLLTAGKRKRFASVDTSEENKAPQTLKLQIDGQTKIIGPKSHINWKSGVYSDENGVQRQLTSEQLEGLRRERNRMHAKMTRDRKKNFIATIEKTIEELERDCQKMRDVLNKVGAHQQVLATPVTPLTSPRENLPTVASEEAATSASATSVVAAADAAAAAAAVAAASATAAAVPPITNTKSAPMMSATASALPSPPKPLLAAAVVKPGQENPAKRAKAAHGFSWNG